MRCGAVLVPVISAGEWDAPVDKTDGEAHVGEPEHKVGYIIFIWQRVPVPPEKVL